MPQDMHFLPGETRQQYLKRVNAGKFDVPLPPKANRPTGVARPGETVQAMLGGKKVLIDGSAITDGEGPVTPKAPTQMERAVKNPPRGMATGPKAGESMSRTDLFRGATSEGSMLKVSTPERTINMKSGMGNTDAKKVFAEKPTVTRGLIDENPLKFIGANSGIPMGKALGYGVSLVQRGLEKGNTGMVKSDYVERLKGSDVFRKLDSQSQSDVLKAYNQWFDTQSAFSQAKRDKMERDERKIRMAGFGRSFSM